MYTETSAKFPGGTFIRRSIILLYREIPQRLKQILGTNKISNLYRERSECRQIHKKFCASPQTFVFYKSGHVSRPIEH